jgi:ATP-dependent Clp protease ATP-binding subunit ClpA
VAELILKGMVQSLLKDLRNAQNVEVSMGEAATEALRRHCLLNLSNGGRGIRNQIETHLMNPLARALFDADAVPGDQFVITAIEPGYVTTLSLTRADRDLP